MFPRSTVVFCILSFSVIQAQEQDFTDPDVAAPVAENLEGRPRLAIDVSDDGDLSIDGVSFDDKQIAVVFRLIAAQEPQIVLLLQANSVAMKHTQRILRIANKEGISSAVFSPLQKQKPENKAEMATPRKPSD
ncbi:ExbD/TolR family protein [Luteolibacter sp. AS25]|uniref:ExbD/TolR family protein n=1 Tax=Luteolibacter sp. AS25 TaxID=3135776 RepID=UPI00398ACFA6